MSSVSQFPPPHLIAEEGDQESTAPESDSPIRQVLALPCPIDAASSTTHVDGQDVRFDHLGPIVVNTDGTLSRIHNWTTMTEAEKERTVRVIGKRNQIRLKALKEQEEASQQDAETKNNVQVES